MRISSKLVLFALTCSILPLLAAFWLSFEAVHESLDETVEDTLTFQAVEELDALQRRLAAAREDLTLFGQMNVMQAVEFSDWGGKLQADLDRFANLSTDYVDIMVTDADGVVVAATDLATVGSDVSGTWEFEAPRLGIAFDGPVTESYRLDRMIATQSLPILSRKVAQWREEVIGTVIGSISWESLTRELRELTLFGGPQGPGRQIVLQSTLDDRVLYVTPGTEVPTALLSPSDGASTFHAFDANGRSVLAVSADSRAIGPFGDPGWRMHVVLDSDIAHASVNELRDWFVVVGASVLVLASLLAFVLSRSITRPVSSLVEAAHRLADGEKDEPIACGGRDEIGQLSQSFERMRRAVHENERELIHKTEQSEAAARLKGEFLANMSHEVRTPINGVLGMTELLLNTELDETQGRYAETIFRSGQSLLSVINDILDFSKIEAGKLEVQDVGFDLRELVEDVFEMVAESAHKKGLELALDMPPGSHVAYRGDSNRIRQILLNLISNAIKFTARGEVRLEVRPFELEAERDADGAVVREARTAMSLKVIDTGIGIPESALENVFESFTQADGSTTRRFGGTGLGLAISSRLAGLMGGGIEVSSVVGEGSCFELHVPLEELSASVTDVWRNPDALKGRRVLVVDDNAYNREILETQMRFWGAEPTMAVDGPEALEKVLVAEDSRLRFDLIVLDMHMPGMNGLELCQALQRNGRLADVPVVLLSSVCDQLDPSACAAAGIHSVITKPVRQPELYRCLTALLGGDRHAVPSRRRTLATRQLAGRILLAEDNPTNQFMMTEMLRQLGLDLAVADHGRAAIELLEDGGYEEGGFDVVLMDCQMPVLDGFAASREIRERERSESGRRRMPIVALTANALEGDREACLEAGMDEYLSKPVSAKRLVEQLSVWMAEAEEPDAGPEITAAEATTETADGTAAGPAPAADDTGEPILDRSVYDEVVEMAAGAHEGFLGELLANYRESSAEDLAGVHAGLEAGDAATVASRAHRLKSSSANWGARRLATCCAAIETAARAGDLAAAAVPAAALASALDELLAEIDPTDVRRAA